MRGAFRERGGGFWCGISSGIYQIPSFRAARSEEIRQFKNGQTIRTQESGTSRPAFSSPLSPAFPQLRGNGGAGASSGYRNMPRIKSPFPLLPLSVALCLGFVASAGFPSSVQAQSRQAEIAQNNITGNWKAFTPPKVGLPGQRQDGGGVRGANNNACPADAQLTALMPSTNIGLTVSEMPTMFWYVPGKAPIDVEFVLREADGQVIDQQTLTLTETPGIVSLTPAKPLEVGKDYHWFFSTICNASDRAGDRFVGGWIRRVDKSDSLQSQLAAAKDESDRPGIYARESLWFDTLASLAQLMRQNPNNPTVTAKWEELLQSVDLATLAKEPFVKINQARLPQTNPQ